MGKKLKALKKLKQIDIERAADAAKMATKVAARLQEFEEQKRAEELRQQEAERKRREAERIRKCTCSFCGEVFVNEHAKNQHFNSKHTFRCDYCYRDFNSRHALNQHKTALGHW